MMNNDLLLAFQSPQGLTRCADAQHFSLKKLSRLQRDKLSQLLCRKRDKINISHQKLYLHIKIYIINFIVY